MRATMTPTLGWTSFLMAVAVLCLVHRPVAAQSQRDPTLPPAAAGLSVDRPVAARGADLLEKDGYSIIVRDGKPFLVVGTRTYTQGEKLGTAVIERITETEVWLREGRELRKISQFAGIQRRVVSVGADVPVPACATSAPKASGRAKIPATHSSTKAPRMTSCADDQP